jgi:hypothetical protein
MDFPNALCVEQLELVITVPMQMQVELNHRRYRIAKERLRPIACLLRRKGVPHGAEVSYQKGSKTFYNDYMCSGVRFLNN